MNWMSSDHPVRALKLRWATWWPVPYWVERYNALASQNGIDLEVVFLSAESKFLPTRAVTKNWKFKYQIIRKEKAVSGYAKVNCRSPMPWPIVRGDFDLLVMPYGDPDFVSAAFLCSLLRKRVCIFSPNHEYEERSFSVIREKLKKFVYASASGVLATGMEQKKYAGKYFKNHENIHIIGNPAPGLPGLDSLCSASIRLAVRDKLGWCNQFVVLYVGRFSSEKGVFTLLDTIEILSKKHIPVKAVFVGMGPCAEDLKAQVESRKLNVEFTGFIEGVSLTQRYIAADVFVLPSFSEAWGLVVNEAMEAGLPVVASHKVGSHPSLVHHGKNGFVFQAGNAESLAEKLVYIYKNPKIRNKMSNASMDIIRKHTIAEWVGHVTEAVDKMTATYNQN
jgi:glycosyltransferase involved in cell wall biosynthesis